MSRVEKQPRRCSAAQSGASSQSTSRTKSANRRSAAQCGTIGGLATCTGSQAYRLSSYPQGRIEVFNDAINSGAGGWGTVCGHWVWDNDGLADMVCRKMGYDGEPTNALPSRGIAF